MGTAPLPSNELERLAVLARYAVLDTPPDPAFDTFVRLAAALCDVPIAIVSFVDQSRQWFKASIGLDGLSETPRDVAVCAHALASPDLLEVGDLTRDPRFAENPLVTGPLQVRFYAGMPLVDRDGFVLGTLCTLDRRPRSLSPAQRTSLRDLASSLVRLIESRAGVAPERLAEITLLTRAFEYAAEPLALVKLDAVTKRALLVFVNTAFCDLFGYVPSALIGESPSILFGPRTDPTALASLRSASALGEPATEILELYGASGDTRFIELRDRAIDALYRVVSCKDLTRSFAAQKALVHANQRMHSLFSNNTDAVLTIDTQGRCIEANPAATAIFHTTREALLDRGYLAVAADELFPGGEAFPAALLAGEAMTFRRTHRRDDGIAFVIDYKAIPILVDGDAEGAFVIAKDVTEAIRRVALIEQQAKRTHALCRIAGTRGLDEAQQIDGALETVLVALDVAFGYVGEIVDGSLEIRHTVGDRLVTPGTILPLEKTYVRQTLDVGDTFAISDMSSPDVARPGLPTYANWHGYIAAPLTIDGRTYGAIGFVARRRIEFTAADREFVTLVAALISATLERQEQKKRLDRLAYSDALTGLPNRARVLQDLESEISRARRYRRGLALHFIDLDGFKAINDRYGHAVGDRVLRDVAERLRRAIRKEDTPGRLGGDEFVVLQGDVDHPSAPETLARRIVATLAEPYAWGASMLALSASVGIAIFPDDGVDAQTLLHNADLALYRAKSNGKGRAERTIDRAPFGVTLVRP